MGRVKLYYLLFAGAHSIIVSCWRPVGDSVVEELRRFFIGGTCQLEDPTFAKIPGSFEVSIKRNTITYLMENPNTKLVNDATLKLFLRWIMLLKLRSHVYI